MKEAQSPFMPVSGCQTKAGGDSRHITENTASNHRCFNYFMRRTGTVLFLNVFQFFLQHNAESNIK